MAKFYRDSMINALMKNLNLNQNLESFQSAFIDEPILFEKSTESPGYYNQFEVVVAIPLIPTCVDFFTFLRALKNLSNQNLHVSVKFNILSYEIGDNKIFYYVKEVVQTYDIFSDIRLFFSDSSFFFDINKRAWVWSLNSQELKEKVESKRKPLIGIIHGFGLTKFDFEVDYKEIKKLELTEEQLKAELEFKVQMRQALEREQKEADDSLVRKIRNNNFRRNAYRDKTYHKYQIKDLHTAEVDEQKLDVNFLAEVYSVEETKANSRELYIRTYKVTDYNEAITIRHYSNEQFSEPASKPGSAIEVFGELKQDSVFRKKFVIAHVIKETAPIYTPPKDEAVNKRVELSVRSKMSTMDGIINPSDIIKRAAHYGHKAVAIVDSDGVQGHPEFYQSALKEGVKPIYGTSIKTVSAGNNIFCWGNPPKGFVRDFDYVSFDIETTGLSSKAHELIEFGSVLVSKNKILERHQFFVKAKEPITSKTTELTKITQEHVDSGLELKEALLKIHAILDNKIAVAHNANFDTNFLFEKFLENGIPLPSTVFIDSLIVSRLVFKDKKAHRLESFCSYLGVNYDTSTAHRADVDAEVLAKAWIAVIPLLEDLNLDDFQVLSTYNDELLIKKQFPYEVSLLALNQDAIKRMWKFVSYELTEKYYDKPKVNVEEIPRGEGLLLGSGGLKSRVIELAFYGSQVRLEKEMIKFDYIEIPAPQVFSHRVQYGEFTQKQVHDILLNLYRTAKKLGIMAVATGDVRYLDKKDKVAHTVLVHSKGIGGENHFLFSYKNKEDIKLPDLDFLTTQEMLNQFEFIGNDDEIEELVIDNPNKIADMVEEIEVVKKDLYTPKFDNSAENLKNLVYKTAHEKYGDVLPQIIADRIESELTPVIKYGFDVVYWISHKLVKMSLDNGYLVGSRGSVGSSFIATMAGITEVNPLEPHYVCPNCKHFELANNPEITSGYDLDDKNCPKCNTTMDKDGQWIPFETFLGFKADKVPDIDLNFSGEYQSTIHNQVKVLFGEYHTFRAGTISTIKEKMAYGYVKAYSEETKKRMSEGFIDYISNKLTGVKRTTGQHPGGIIIIPKEFDVEDFTPTNFPADDTTSSWKTTHFDFHTIHDNVLKLDILGHLDPTAIKMLERLTGLDVKKDVPKKDPKVMSIFSSTESLGIKPEDIGGEKTGAIGIPEFGTGFTRKMLDDAQAKSFADLVSISGLSHGTNVWLNNAEMLIKQKGLKLKEVICCRDDIMRYLILKGVDPLYSFKVMEQVRKGKGVAPDQVEELKKHDVPDWYIESMQKIAYMFPKSHAAAYVLMAWRVAYFKVYYPLEYYATYFTTRCETFDISTMSNDDAKASKINARIKELDSKDSKELSNKEKDLYPTLEAARELYARGFKIANINLQRSLATEWVVDKETKSIIPPFNTMDGLGESVALSIVQARNERDFMTIEDLKARTTINNTIMNNLKNLGVLEGLDENDQMSLF
ncbi:PolC-type DNA polymerase III [Mycoplasma sp. Ms02]|uniref:PolC-type DNA polymerase III n=1 Tax=Mycoplasma sp. Ms02 TaxID=353851 RepID=UPI001C8AD200|nr:PolC-type DNA polymerase III [Mycoplasma sp. Ms02]QZE12176.1 PolC-type DNA polymerase III [Mycoplasma sp. Ms02]